MSLEVDVDAEPELLQRVTAVARRSSCPLFCDLSWPPSPSAAVLLEDPGLMFESPRRVFVFQRFGEELRYYAGAWSPNDALVHQERVEVEGSEAGVVRTVLDALAFAEQYLVEERCFVAVSVPRDVRYSRAHQTEGLRKAAS